VTVTRQIVDCPSDIGVDADQGGDAGSPGVMQLKMPIVAKSAGFVAIHDSFHYKLQLGVRFT
jgi:hypothetical protein